jgi:hypothetical protein
MVQPENIDSGHSNFQLDTRCGGYSRNLDYLLVYLASSRRRGQAERKRSREGGVNVRGHY